MDPDQSDDPQAGGIELERLLAECLASERPDRALEETAARHPELAAELRELFALLGAVDLAPRVAAEAPQRFGDYQLIRRLSGGAMAAVWVARDLGLGRTVVLKMLRPEDILFEGRLERFRREIDVVAGLRHPGIVPVHSAGDIEGVPYFTSEWVDGPSLALLLATLSVAGVPELRAFAESLAAAVERDRVDVDTVIERLGPRWSDAVLRLTLELTEALAAAHSQGVAHRDLKPSNVVVDADGRPRLIDFGLAWNESADALTRSGAQLGSLPYMPPERVRGDRQQDAFRGDVYGLGVVLYELLTLTRPFHAVDREALERQIRAGVVEPPRRRMARIPRDLETLCLAMLDPDAARRPADAGEVAADLRRILDHRPIVARRSGSWTQAVRLVRRRPTAAMATAGLVLLAAATVLFVERQAVALQRAQRQAHAREAYVLLDDLERITPVAPEKLAAYDNWLARADELRDAVAGYRQQLDELRHRGQRLPDHEAAPLLLARAEEATRNIGKAIRYYSNFDEYRNRTDAIVLEQQARWREIRERRAWRFDDPDDQVLHDVLVDLCSGGDELQRARELVSRWRELALEIDAAWRRSDLDALWDAALADLERHTGVAGQLRPTSGLVPLGPDPVSRLHEFAVVATGRVPERGRDGVLLLGDDSAAVLVLIPAGEVVVGANLDDPTDARYHDAGELPVDRVWLAPYLIGKHELSQAQWERFLIDNPSTTTGPDRRRHPVETLDSNSLRRDLQRIGLDLPTEAQWEHAARGGTRTAYWFGSDPADLQGRANLGDRTYGEAFRAGEPESYAAWDDGWLATCPIDTFEANQFGLHGVLGNVSETCLEYGVDSKGYLAKPASGPTGQRWCGFDGYRFQNVRGGNFSFSASYLRHALRGATLGDAWTTGVRVVWRL